VRIVFHFLSLIAVLTLVPAFYEAPAVPGANANVNANVAATSSTPDYAEVRSFLEARMHFTDVAYNELTRTILTEARRAGLEPSLIVSLIHVESSGNPRAISKVGAMGLMQLLPGTAEAMSAELGIAWEGPDSLYDPNFNVRLGVYYLGKLVTRFENLDTALAAYNWGPTHIARVIRKGSALPVRYSESVHRARVAVI
jgi:soluble lytic murein transglycosylase-like protein